MHDRRTDSISQTQKCCTAQIWLVNRAHDIPTCADAAHLLCDNGGCYPDEATHFPSNAKQVPGDAHHFHNFTMRQIILAISAHDSNAKVAKDLSVAKCRMQGANLFKQYRSRGFRWAAKNGKTRENCQNPLALKLLHLTSSAHIFNFPMGAERLMTCPWSSSGPFSPCHAQLICMH